MDKALTSRSGPWIAGGFLGLIAVLLVKFGNPGNMGFCVACFTRDIAGALGLHRAAIVQYIRPEIPGFILGSFVSALLFREYSPRGGSSPVVRFALGIFAMLGALVFLGCPWRAYLRVAGGDWNALYGVGGLIVGIFVGICFLWSGYSLGAAKSNPKASGLVMPVIALALLAFLFLPPTITNSEGASVSLIFSSESGPGSLHAPALISLAAGLIVGWLAQRTRFCTVGAIRDLLMMGDGHLFKGIVAFTLVAFIANFCMGFFSPDFAGFAGFDFKEALQNGFGYFKPGFEKQAVAHTNELWNFLGMVLSGLAFTLAGGCPGRQLIMAGEGDSDAAIFVVGMLVGAAMAHNLSAASSGAGIGPMGIPVTIAGLIFCVLVGMCCRSATD